MNAPTVSNDEQQSPRTRFQFGLRAMLLWVAAFSMLFAVLEKVGPVWKAVIVWCVVLVGAHVAANVLGSRLGGKRRRAELDTDGTGRLRTEARYVPPRFAPATRLCETARLGRAPLALTLLGVLVGGSLGTIAFAVGSWERSGYAGVIVAGISSSIVGGFLAFLSGSFLQTAFQALHEAANVVHPTDSARPCKLERREDGEPPALPAPPERSE